MSIDLVIDSSEEEVSIALLKNKKLLELHKEKSSTDFCVGDLYIGRVKRIMPGLNAAFVDVGYEKDAFLHYLDLGPQFKSLDKYVGKTLQNKNNTPKLGNFKKEDDIEKTGKIDEVLKSNMHILVKIAKEPISSKGPRLSCELSIPGRYIILVPFSNKVSVSQKIQNNKERERLISLIKSIKPAGFGIIIRTVAEEKKVADLHADLEEVIDKWNGLYNKIKKVKKPPQKVHSELDRSSSLLRDLLNSNFNEITVNKPELHQELKNYVKTIAPGKEEIVKLYSNSLPIFEHYKIEYQIKKLFGKNVTMRSGAYLVIEHTEALHVIDVNSGQRGQKKGGDQEKNALAVNLESAEEIARQLRLRDMGGIIVVDFIDMRQEENRMTLYKKFKSFMKDDRAKHSILPPSRFGLIELTRQRVRPEMAIKTAEGCPCCNGSGEVQSTLLLVDKILADLKAVISREKLPLIFLHTHPFIAAYINQRKGWFSSMRKDWQAELGTKVEVIAAASCQLLEYKFFTKAQEEIQI